jgi:phi13 family phage major tail protein
MPKKNKVKFNICNVHYAILTVADDGTFSYGTPVPMPGAVSLSLDANGEPTNFYADGYAYYIISNNMGYDGDLELAMVPESFRTDVLKEQLDSNNVLIENSKVEAENFALLFEFDGDVKKIRHVLYKCAASRPGIESQTNEDEVEVKTETLSIKATPLANGYVKAKTGDNTSDAVYQNWYSAVYIPSSEGDGGDDPVVDDGTDLASLTIGSLTLTPAFNADTIAYTASTTNATNTITAVAADAEAEVAITFNGTAHTSGQAATWETGDNIVRIVVTNGNATKAYTVTVTKTEEG